MATIGFIGLGNMGLPMARNLLKAGHKVQGFDVSKAQIDGLAASGGKAASSVKAAVSGAEIVVIFPTTPPPKKTPCYVSTSQS